MKLFDDIKKAFNIIKEFEVQQKENLAILDKQIKDLNELNYILNKYKPKTNTMLTKKKLKEEIDEFKEEARVLRLFVGELNDRVKLLEDPPKYKVGQVVGKYTITEYVGKRFFIMNEYKKYRAIKKGEIVDVSEEKLDKQTKHNKK